jgi:hypothetical protein
MSKLVSSTRVSDSFKGLSHRTAVMPSGFSNQPRVCHADANHDTFRANDIDGELLGRLTSDDLKEIGVASFGHRKKLLDAIAELGNAPAAAPAVTRVMPAPISAAVAPPQISAAVEATAGRQQCGEAERLCRTSYNRNFIQ